jgi:hypothetical protein
VLARSIEHVGLATHPDFQDLFVEGMSFLKSGAAADDQPTPAKRRRSGGRRAAAGGD